MRSSFYSKTGLKTGYPMPIQHIKPISHHATVIKSRYYTSFPHYLHY